MLKIPTGTGRAGTQDRTDSPNGDLDGEKSGCVCFETFPFTPLAWTDLGSKKRLSREQDDNLAASCSLDYENSDTPLLEVSAVKAEKMTATCLLPPLSSPLSYFTAQE